MTIIAGFRCEDGIVVCADTQESDEISKRNVPKLRFEGTGLLTDVPLAVAFCGAGYGPWIDRLVDQAWEDVQVATSLDDACEEARKSIEETYKHYGEIYQAGERPTAELIYGIKASGGSRLFSAHGPIVNERHGYHSSGAGYFMADFIAGRMYADHLTLHQGVILAAYILFQAKEHVPGCGGESHIAVLRDEGMSGKVDVERVEELTTLLQFSDFELGRLLLRAANFDLESEEFDSEAKEIIENIAKIRVIRKGALEDRLKRYELIAGLLGTEPLPQDSFGLPIFPIKSEKGDKK